MNQFMATHDRPTNRMTRQSAKVQPVLLFLVCLLLGGAAGLWIYRASQARRASSQAAGIGLSESTRAVLKGLKSTVEIRFYSILETESGTDALRTFAARVDELLSAYERESDGKINVRRRLSRADADIAAAEADGVRGFSVGQTDCFLGLVVAQQDRKETLAKLDPEWEAAVEPDLTRAIQRVASASSVAARATALARAETQAAEEVERSLTNLASVPVQQGRQMLREAAIKELRSALAEIEGEIKQARERLSEAQASRSEAEQQAAIKEIQQLQSRQAEKVKEITARLQAQTAAFERLKANP